MDMFYICTLTQLPLIHVAIKHLKYSRITEIVFLNLCNFSSIVTFIVQSMPMCVIDFSLLIFFPLTPIPELSSELLKVYYKETLKQILPFLWFFLNRLLQVLKDLSSRSRRLKEASVHPSRNSQLCLMAKSQLVFKHELAGGLKDHDSLTKTSGRNSSFLS